VGHLVHSGGSRVQKIDALFSRLGVLDAVSIRSALGHSMLNLCF
jgi:hypothetical protein